MTDNASALMPREESSLLDWGSTALDATDFVPPRVKVVQQMSAEATADVDPAKPGEFWNTLTKENYGRELRFVPIHAFKQRIFLVREGAKRDQADEALAGAGLAILGDTTGLACRSIDMRHGTGIPGILCGKCPLALWTGEGNRTPPLCTETYNVSAITELGELIILGFSKSSAKTGKQLFSMLRLSGRDPWTSVYVASTRKTTNDLGTFFIADVAKAKTTGKDGGKPLNTPDELQKVARDWAVQFRGVIINVTPLDEDEPEGGVDHQGKEPF